MTNLKMNLKLFATVMLLLFLWQDAECGNITLISCLNERLCGKDGIKYKITDKVTGNGIGSEHVVVKRFEKSETFQFDPSTQKLWAAPESSYRYSARHYSEIIIPDDRDCTVIITQLYAYSGTPVYEVRAGMPVGEPVFCAHGKAVAGMYSLLPKVPLPSDISMGFPLYAATFNYTFNDTATSRISLGSEGTYVSPRYVIEFYPSAAVEQLPITEQNEIAKAFLIDDLSKEGGLYKQLSTLGVNISVKACAFNIDNPNFIVNAMNLDTKGRPVLVGLFNSKNVEPGFKDPITKGMLSSHSIPVLGCQLTSKVASFDVVTITEDLKNICVMRALVMPNCDELVQDLCAGTNFSTSVNSALAFVEKCSVPADRAALSEAVFVLGVMTGNEIPVLPFGDHKKYTPYSFIRKINGAVPSLSVQGIAPSCKVAHLLSLPSKHFKEGSNMSVKGFLKKGRVEFGLHNGKGTVAGEYITPGEFNVTITSPGEVDCVLFLAVDIPQEESDLGFDVTITDLSFT